MLVQLEQQIAGIDVPASGGRRGREREKGGQEETGGRGRRNDVWRGMIKEDNKQLDFYRFEESLIFFSPLPLSSNPPTATRADQKCPASL